MLKSPQDKDSNGIALSHPPDAGNQHRQLFEQLEEGFLSAEIVRDQNGRIIDWRFVEVNKAILKHLSRPASEIVGQLRSVAFPGLDEVWMHMVNQVTETQQSLRHQLYYEEQDGWAEIIMFPFGPERFAVLYYDITGKRQRESNAAFQDSIVHELTTLSTPEEIMETVGSMVGEYLKVSSCSFVDIDDAAGKVIIQYGWQLTGIPTLKQTFNLDDYLNEEYCQASRAGQTVVVDDAAKDERADTEAYARMQIGALITVPFIWEGRWIASACITSREPRNWEEEEIALLQAIATRLFARIGRARVEQELRRSEEKYRILFETIDEGFCFIQMIYDEEERPVDWIYLEANPTFKRQTGLEGEGKRVSEIIPDVEECWFRFYAEVAKTRKPARKEGPVASIGRWFSVRATPIGDTGDIVAVAFEDITDRKLAEK
jgi:GAF domain-containing protein